MLKEDKKNVLLVVPTLRLGGQEKVCLTTARLLQEEYNAYVVIFDGENAFYETDGLQVIDLKIASTPKKMKKVINVFRRITKLRRLKKKLHIDISYSFGLTADIANAFSKKRELNIISIRSWSELKEWFLLKSLVKKADIVICCSKEMARELSRRVDSKKIVGLCNPYKLDDIRAKAQIILSDANKYENQTVLVSMGRLHDQKGFWHLIKAMKLVAEKMPDVILLILGSGETQEYQRLIDELGVSSNVKLLGSKENPFPYLKKAQLYVMSSNVEGFPNALIESMAVGLPIVSTNCKTGPAEILDPENIFEKEKEINYCKYGILVNNLNGKKDMRPCLTEEDECLANAIITILQNEELRLHYAKQSLIRAENFSDIRYKSELVELINSGGKNEN